MSSPPTTAQPVDLGIVVALQEEFRELLALSGAYTSHKDGVLTSYCFERGPYRIVATFVGDMGETQATRVTERLITLWEPGSIVVVGIAAGVHDDLRVGDVYVPPQAVQYLQDAKASPKKDAPTEYTFIPGAPAYRADTAWHEAVKHLEFGHPDVHGRWRTDCGADLAVLLADAPTREHLFSTDLVRREVKLLANGHVATGPVVGAAPAFSAWIRSHDRNVKALEMESAAVLLAAQTRDTPTRAFAIRGISDYGDDRRKELDAIGNGALRLYAMRNAVRLLWALLDAGALPARIASKAPPEKPKPTRSVDEVDDGPPKPAHFIGRDPLATELAGQLKRDRCGPTAILGPGGIGKTTLSLAALHRSEVVERYGGRRWFVRLDTTTTAELARHKIAESLGVSTGEIGTRLARAPAVLVLDNLETPWEHDRESTEALLGGLAAIPGIALVASIRGAHKPAGLVWQKTIRVEPLTPDMAKELFCAIAPEHRHRAELTALLAPLGGIPLAITLFAHAAEGNDLKNLAAEWAKYKTALLERPGASPDRLSSWSVSIELSLDSRRMTPETRRLGKLLAALPDGIAVADLDEVLPRGNAAARILAQVGLGFFEGSRLQMLAPVREYLAREHAPETADLDRAMEHYGELVDTVGAQVGNKGGEDAVARLAPERANLDAMVRRGLRERPGVPWIEVAITLAVFAQYAGRRTPSLLEYARDVARLVGEHEAEAECLVQLGSLLKHNGTYEEARVRYEEARSIYQQIGAARGEAQSVLSLGEIAWALGDREQAQTRLEEARLLFRQLGDVAGEAGCVWELGQNARVSGKLDQANARIEEALLLFRQVGVLQGEGVCLGTLGELAQERSNLEQARTWLEQAASIFHQIGDVRNESVCLSTLGDIALERSEHEQARARFEDALPLLQQVDDVARENRCREGLAKAKSGIERQQALRERELGEGAEARGATRLAISCYERALALEIHVGRLTNQAAVLDALARCHAALGEERVANDLRARARVLEEELAYSVAHGIGIIHPEDVTDNNDLKNYFRQRLGPDFDELSFILMDRQAYIDLIHGDDALLASMIMEDAAAANDIFIAFAGDRLNRVVITMHIEAPDVGNHAVEFIRAHKKTPMHEVWLAEMEELAVKTQALHRRWKAQPVAYYKLTGDEKSSAHG